jgi:hypothetical protein
VRSSLAGCMCHAGQMCGGSVGGQEWCHVLATEAEGCWAASTAGGQHCSLTGGLPAWRGVAHDHAPRV